MNDELHQLLEETRGVLEKLAVRPFELKFVAQRFLLTNASLQAGRSSEGGNVADGPVATAVGVRKLDGLCYQKISADEALISYSFPIRFGLSPS